MSSFLTRALLLASLGFVSACQVSTNFLNPFSTPAQRQYELPGEYEPVEAVMVSEHLATFRNGQEFMNSLIDEGINVWLLSGSVPQVQQTRQIMSERFGLTTEEIKQVQPLPVLTETVWARDWAPLMARHIEDKSKWGLVDFTYYPDRLIDDGAPERLAQVLKDNPPHLASITNLSFDNLPVPVELEGGNVMCNPNHCFVTEEVLLRLEQRGETADAETIVDQLEKYIRQEFWIVPRMPFEGTGHIDIWAKFLNPKQVIVGQITEESLALIPAEQAQTYQQVREFLEEQATGLDANGNTVSNSLAEVLKREAPDVEILRIPMPTPGVYRGIETFRTYTNSLFVNNTAIVPRYLKGTRSERQNRNILQEQEERVEAIYKAAGFDVKWILADNLIRDGGAWHCVSMQVPQLKSE